jgi:hypothetical protein
MHYENTYYCSCPAFIKRYFPKTREWLETTFWRGCREHDMAYGKYFVTEDGKGNTIHAKKGDKITKRFDADTKFFCSMVKINWLFLPFAFIVRLYFLIFGGIVWQNNKEYYNV